MEPSLSLGQAALLIATTYTLAVLIAEMELFQPIRDWLKERCLAPEWQWYGELDDNGEEMPGESPYHWRVDVPLWRAIPLWFVGSWATCVWCASVIVGFFASQALHSQWVWDWSWSTAATTVACVGGAWFWLYRDFE